MEKIIDFNKYTLGLSTALLFVAPKEFVTTAADWRIWAVYVIVGVALLSAIFGVLVYSSATAALARGKSEVPPILNIFGQIHLWSLLAAFILAALLYGDKYLLSVAEPEMDCPISLDADGRFVVSEDCAARLKGQ